MALEFAGDSTERRCTLTPLGQGSRTRSSLAAPITRAASWRRAPMCIAGARTPSDSSETLRWRMFWRRCRSPRRW